MLSTRELVDQTKSTRLCANSSRGSNGRSRILPSRLSADCANGEKEHGAAAIRREAKQIKERVRRAGISETINGIHELNTKFFGIDTAQLVDLYSKMLTNNFSKNLAPNDLHFDNQAKLATCRVVLQHMVKLVRSRPELVSKLCNVSSEMKAIARACYQHKHSRRRLTLVTKTSPVSVVDQNDKENYNVIQDIVGKTNTLSHPQLPLYSTPNNDHRSAFKPYHRPVLAPIQSTPGRSINSMFIPLRWTEDVKVSCCSQSITLNNRYLSTDSGFQSPNDQSSSINGLDLSLKSHSTNNNSPNEIWRPWDW